MGCFLKALLILIFLHVVRGNPVAAQASDQVLYRFSGAGLYDEAFGPLHEIEVATQKALKDCGSRVRIVPSGRMDSETQKALTAVAICPRIAARLSPSSEAHKGAITEELWALLVGSAPPGFADRARTMMLTFEATDYTALEWNFCQSRPLYNPPNQPLCFSNDPHSFITWGANGATAGGGREVQAILQQIARAHLMVGKLMRSLRLIGITALLHQRLILLSSKIAPHIRAFRLKISHG